MRTKSTRGKSSFLSIRHISKGHIRLALVAVLLIAFLVLTFFVARDYFEVDEVTLPDTIGMNYNDAIDVLKGLELEVSNYTESVPGAAVNTVTSQSPAPGTVVRRGRNVSIGVNSPTEDMRIPDLVGLSLDQVNRLLGELNLQLSMIRYEFSAAPRNQVLAQSPAPGEIASGDSDISVTLSRGPEPVEIVLPDLRGMSLEAAMERLKELGVRRIETLATSLSFSRAGVVTEQSPAPQQQVSLGTPVVLEYALSSRTVVPVPDLQGLSLTRAQRLLQAAGLELSWGALNYVNEPDQPQGIVDYQPRNYTLAGTPVVVTVNGSPSGANAPVRLPDLEDDRVGSPLAEPLDRQFEDRFGDVSRFGNEVTDAGGGPLQDGAEDDSRSLLDDLFSLDDETDDPAGSASQSGTVDSPSQSEPLVDGARRVPITFDPAAYGLPADQSYDFVLRIQDERGERIGIERTLAPGASVDTSVVVYGETLLQIELDGTIYTAWNPY